jgi:hypothetical protein
MKSIAHARLLGASCCAEEADSGGDKSAIIHLPFHRRRVPAIAE